MNEVSTHSVGLVLDALEQHGLAAASLWDGLPLDREQMRRRQGVPWRVWVEWLARIEAHSPLPLEDLFVPGAANRTGHPFARIAKELVTVPDMYSLIARWGIPRAFLVLTASFDITGNQQGRFVTTIDPAREGSLPTLRFLVGMLRSVPTLQGYGPAEARLVEGATSHQATIAIEFPADRPLRARARRLVRAVLGRRGTLDELEAQAHELATKHAELARQLAATQEQQRWLDGALNAGKIGLWRWDPVRRRVRVSPTLAQWLGMPGATEVAPSDWERIAHPDDQARIAQLFARAFVEQRPFETEFRFARSAHDVAWYHMKGRIETGSDGQVYVYGSTVDISEEKRLESRLRMADRLIAAGTLAAGIAHEINNPLTYMIGSIDLIQRRLAHHPEARAVTKDLLAQVLDGTERIRAVVADVRAFARRDDNEVAAVDLNAVCAGAIRIVSADVRHRATLVTELSPAAPAVVANDARLGQVVINLIVNASQAMPSDRPAGDNQIVVRTHRLASGDATLEVEDNGVGIPPDVLPRVFDPFFTTKPVGVGTGLGLSVCQGIVASLGGRIEVTSTLGRGSRFTVTLAAAQLGSATPVVTDVREALGGRILVIDDEPLIRSVVARTLAASGYAVDEAASGREGLARATSNGSYDAILCDVMMPDLDGRALHETLLCTRPELAGRIVFISGGAVTERTQEFLQTPGLVVLSKPFAFEHLVEAIERAAHGTRTSLPLT